MKRLEGKTALITGGAGGMGTAISQRFAENGARVVVADINMGQAEAVAAGIRQRGMSATAIALDVTDEASWAGAMEAVARVGQLHVLVNNAGTTSPASQYFWEFSLEEWRRIMAINLDGVFMGTRAGINAMRDSGTAGSIVNIASIATFFGVPKSGPYAVSKGAVRTLSLQAAMSCADAGLKIRVNSIHPGHVWTQFGAEKWSREGGGEEKARTAMREANPMKEMVEPDDVAWAAVYLASEEAKRVTGSDLVVDAGRLLL